MVSVADTGLGIAPELLDAIFEPFRRITPSNNVVPGVGLGLSTCRRIVVAHGGRIDVASELGRGTTFTVHLPGSVASGIRHPLPAASDVTPSRG
jgi:signal transduction histidine kinase